MVTTDEVREHLIGVLGVDAVHVKSKEDPALSLTTVLQCLKLVMQLVSICRLLLHRLPRSVV